MRLRFWPVKASRRFANDVERWIRDAPSSYDANRAAWVQFIEPLIDRSKYIDLNGDPMSDQDFIEMLGRAFDTICSDGANSDFEVSTVAGPSASRANRGDLHRGLHFKDASSWLQYQRTFGQGTVFDLMRGSLRRSAKDAELMRSLGPNPNATYAAMKRMAKAEADQINAKMQGRPGIVQTMKAGLSEHYIDTEWSVLNGSAASVDASRAALADISGGMRNLEVATKLGSTFLSSVSDIPTYYSMSDYYMASVDNSYTYLKNNSNESRNDITDSPEGRYDYSLVTPWKFMASTAFIIGKKGIVSFDYEYTAYDKMSLSETDGLEMNDINDDISSYFKAGHTFRVGGEYRITPQLSARLGYANQLSPMKVSTGDELNIAGMAPHYTLDRGTQYYTCGLGYRFGIFYADMAYIHKNAKSDVLAFSPIPSTGLTSEVATLHAKNNSFILTLGFKF